MGAALITGGDYFSHQKSIYLKDIIIINAFRFKKIHCIN